MWKSGTFPAEIRISHERLVSSKRLILLHLDTMYLFRSFRFLISMNDPLRNGHSGISRKVFAKISV